MLSPLVFLSSSSLLILFGHWTPRMNRRHLSRRVEAFPSLSVFLCMYPQRFKAFLSFFAFLRIWLCVADIIKTHIVRKIQILLLLSEGQLNSSSLVRGRFPCYPIHYHQEKNSRQPCLTPIRISNGSVRLLLCTTCILNSKLLYAFAIMLKFSSLAYHSTAKVSRALPYQCNQMLLQSPQSYLRYSVLCHSMDC